MIPYREIDLGLTAEEEELKLDAHRFAREVLRPAATELDRIADPRQVIRPGSTLFDVFREASARRYHTMLLPKEIGGLGLRGTGLHILLEEL